MRKYSHKSIALLMAFMMLFTSASGAFAAEGDSSSETPAAPSSSITEVIVDESTPESGSDESSTPESSISADTSSSSSSETSSSSDTDSSSESSSDVTEESSAPESSSSEESGSDTTEVPLPPESSSSEASSSEPMENEDILKIMDSGPMMLGAVTTINSADDLTPWFPDPVFRTVVYDSIDAIHGFAGDENQIKDVLAEYKGDIKADHLDIMDAAGLELLRKVGTVDLRYNKITDWSRFYGYDQKYYGEPGKNVTWLIGGNPFKKLPYDGENPQGASFGGRLILSAVTTEATTYEKFSNPIDITSLNDDKYYTIDGIGQCYDMNNKLVSLAQASVLDVPENTTDDSSSKVYSIKIENDDRLKFKVSVSTDNTFAISTDPVINSYAVNEYDTSSLSRTSFKYYIHFGGEIYNSMRLYGNTSFQDISIKKIATDNNDLLLSDAQFDLDYMNADGNWDSTENLEAWDEDDRNPHPRSWDDSPTKLYGLPSGSYRLKETYPPEGYSIPQDPYTYFDVISKDTDPHITISGGVSEFIEGKDGTKHTVKYDQMFFNQDSQIKLTGVNFEKDKTYSVILMYGHRYGNSSEMWGQYNFEVTDSDFSALENRINFLVRETSTTRLNIYVNITDVLNRKTSYAIENEKIPTTSGIIKKVWVDENNKYGKRPESVYVYLEQITNGGKYGEHWSSDLNEEENWQYAAGDLPAQNSDGSETYHYEVSEYIDDFLYYYYTPTYDYDPVTGFTITNTFKMPTVDVTGTKIWKDGGDPGRPYSVTINLLSNGTEIDSRSIIAGEYWEYTFSDLPKLAEDGTDIVYTIEEEPVTGYTTSYNGSDTINTRVIPNVTISGTKTWEDENNKFNRRPWTVLVSLLRDGEEVERFNMGAWNNWTYSFSPQPESRYDDKTDTYHMYTYTVQEEPIEAYVTTYNGYDITNTFTVPKISVGGVKTWADNDNIAGDRPAEITVNLLRDGVKIDSKTTDEANGWAYTFDDLPKIGNDSVDYVYSITENPVAGYTTTYDGYNITNKWIIPKISVSGTKTWEDHENAAGVRPAEITMDLLRDGIKIDSKTVTEADGWAYTFSDLPKTNALGIVYRYSVAEETLDGYNVSYNNYDVTNVRPIEQLSVSGMKIWLGNSNADGSRPASVTINLLRDSAKVDSKTVTAADGWKYSFTGLPKTDFAEADYVYSITGEPVTGYTATYAGYNVVNAKDASIKTLDVSGTKTWEDNNNAAGKRPANITVNLLRDGAKIDSKTVSAAENWGYTFADLPQTTDTGVAYRYTVTEDPVPGYYISGFDGVNLTNTLSTRLITVSGTKTWADNNNAANKRPASVTVNLMRDGVKLDSKTVDTAANWKYSFDKLPESAVAGTIYSYSVEEEPVSGYTTAYEGYNITNTLIIPKVTISGTKAWADNDDKAGIRPNRIIVNLMRDGTKVDSKMVDETNAWKYSFVDLPENAIDGTAYAYTIAENPVAGYTTTYNGNDITNTYVVTLISVSGTKTWDDNNDAAGKRPASITVNLLRDGEKIDSKTVDAAGNWKYSFADLPERAADGTLYVYTVAEDLPAEYAPTYSGYNITNTLIIPKATISGTKTWEDNSNSANKRPSKIIVNLMRNGTEIASRAVGASDGWKYSFVDLPTASVDGTHYIYSVTEEPVYGYTTAYNGNDITNTYVVPQISVSGMKTWDDSNDAADKRPDEITVNLLRDGVKTDSKMVNTAAGWKYSFDNLPQHGSNGTNYVYSIAEEPVAGYTTSYDGFNITNKWIIPKISVSGTKTWADQENAAGQRPASITVNLLQDGTQIDSATVTSAGDWKYSFANLPEYTDTGYAHRYTVAETPVAGYAASYNGFDITNTRPIETISVSGMKIWLDGNNADGSRPANVTINLLRDGAKIDSKTVSAADDWKYSFPNLPKTDPAETGYVYTITEEPVNGYETSYAGYNVINIKGEQAQTINISGVKTWADDNDALGKRPASVKINLLRDKEKADSKTVKASNDWKYTFANLPVKDATGHIYTYTVTEEPVPEYAISAFDGTNITNTLNTRLLTVSGTKTWMDDNDAAKKRPSSITVNLMRDGVKQDGKTVDAAGGWRYSFEKLPETAADGTAYSYSISEEPVSGYTAVYQGYSVTNTIIPPVTISGKKTWDDDNDAAGKRPGSITVNLLRDGVKADSKTVTEADGWKYTFTDLPKADASGTAYVYTVAENAAEGYMTSYCGNNIKNTYAPSKVTVSGVKIWNDGNNSAGKRPASVTVNLLRDGVKADSQTISAVSEWRYNFENLPKNSADGQKITYSVTEDDVDGYTAIYNGYNITNTLNYVPPAPDRPGNPGGGGGGGGGGSNGGGGSSNSKPHLKPKKPKGQIEEPIDELEPIPEQPEPKGDNPPTGASRTGLYIALCMVTLSGGTITLLCLKKRKRGNEKS